MRDKNLSPLFSPQSTITGLRNKIAQCVSQSQSLQIEFDPNGFHPEKKFAFFGTVLFGHVVLRNPQPLSINELRITIYGISDATILRKQSTIRNDFYSQGLFFQEISVLLQGPVILEPTQEGYRYSFRFTMPENTSSMRENEGNFIYRFHPRP
ncbi:MAG: hypothetical protein HETSPECPRED_010556 [Heterodermia speciosa]|uniref:Uncharacterized protein n=1 Tax=Heterodermia speciosa TaxID=116794 RepID=A0A8H3GC32_9LECA|nr:MAG: hypothetical protein HETSPECPRED_010556 [Heterodermia speciosa]